MMRFISFADFNFPSSSISYLQQTFSSWSKFNGAVNFDGVFRVWIRMMNSAVYAVSGSGVVAAYGYIFFIFLLSFLSFYRFCKSFFPGSRLQFILFSLAFAASPIFLGNMAKAGLTLGVVMLPLGLSCLAGLKKQASKVDIVLFAISIVLSFTHPFTFLVNIVGFGLFFLLSTKRFEFVSQIKSVFAGCILAVLLMLPSILLVLSTKTVSKESLVNDVGVSAKGIGGLLSFANTGGVLNAFTLKRDILNDFNYSILLGEQIYVVLVIVILITAFYPLVRSSKQNRSQHIVTLFFMAAYLVVIAFCAGVFDIANNFLRGVNSLPGGWAFRSSIKWQLYLPFLLFSVLATTLNSREVFGRKVMPVLLTVVVSLLSASGMMVDVYRNLLTPKTLEASVESVFPETEKGMFLLIEDSRCGFGDLRTHMFQRLLSLPGVQLKRASSIDADKIDKTAFDVVISCKQLENVTGYTSQQLGNGYVYRNSKKNPFIVVLQTPMFLYGSDLESQNFLEFFIQRVSIDQGISKIEGQQANAKDIFRITNLFSGGIRDEGFARGTASVQVVYTNGDIYSRRNLGRVIRVERRGNEWTLLSKTIGLLRVTEDFSATNNLRLIQRWWSNRDRASAVYAEYADRIVRASDSIEIPFASSIRFKKASTILINPSFETGSWQPTVGDCNRFDDRPILGMSLNRQEKTDGRQSLQLEATRHIACIVTKIALPADISGDHVLSFDYQSPNGQRAGYYLQFDDEKKTVVRETPSITTSTWQSYAKKISIPAGAKNARLYLYGYSLDEQTNVITRYDNVQFGKLELVKTIDIPQEEGYEKIPVTLKEGENRFEYIDPRYDYKNLLPNPSFETRPWQEKVGDCNRYDDNPQLAMRLNEQEKTDGAKSLELEATRHAACMATTVPIKPGATYLLSFDYQSPNAKQASYYIGFNDPEKTSLKDQLAVTSTAWNTFSNTFTVPKGATSLSLYVYARETDKKTAIINRYDNFKLIEVPDLRDAFYLVSEPERKLVEPKAVDFELINPTKKLVHIKGATTPFFLGMSESYHDQWQLQFQNEKIQGVLKRWWPFAKPDRVADEYHYKLNGFLNAWYIDTDDWCATQGKCTKNADGSYDIEMVIEFWPQRWFYLGLLISGTTLAGCLGYLGYEGGKSIRRRWMNRTKE